MNDPCINRDQVAAALPPPDAEEPASLRDDIADELADHLQLALAHELVNTGEEVTARKRVLDRFGDPLAIARRLWWDAMKVRIMRNRLVFLLALCAVTISLVVAGGAYSVARSLREANEQLRASQELMQSQARELAAQQQAFHSKMLERLITKGEDKAPRAVGDWRPFSVRVLTEKTRMPVTATCVIRDIQSNIATPTELSKMTNIEGVADFGTLPPGLVQLSVYSDVHGGWVWNDKQHWIRPDGPTTFELNYPETGCQKGRIRFRVNDSAADVGNAEPHLGEARSQRLICLKPLPIKVSGRDWYRLRIWGAFVPPDYDGVQWSQGVIIDGSGHLLAGDTVLNPRYTHRRSVDFQGWTEFVPPLNSAEGMLLPEGPYSLYSIESFSQSFPSLTEISLEPPEYFGSAYKEIQIGPGADRIVDLPKPNFFAPRSGQE